MNRSQAFDMNTAMIYEEIQADAQRLARPVSVPDAQIAALAQEQKIAILRNIKDFEITELHLINPWNV